MKITLMATCDHIEEKGGFNDDRQNDIGILNCKNNQSAGLQTPGFDYDDDEGEERF